MIPKFFKFNSAEINYRVKEEGTPFVLIHGFAEDGVVWNKQAEELSKEFKVLVIDLPGSGNSTKLGNGSEENHGSIEDMADVVHEMLKIENIASCIMIGHSMGGYITLAFAEKHSDQLKAFGLFHSSAFADNDEKKATRLKAIEHIRQQGAPSFLNTSIPNLFAEKFKKENPDFVDSFIEEYSDFEPEALTGYYYAMINRKDRTDVLKTFSKPILFIVGEEDTAIPLAASLKQCYLPKQSHVHILPQTGHMGMYEEEDLTSKFLVDFCRHAAIQP